MGWGEKESVYKVAYIMARRGRENSTRLTVSQLGADMEEAKRGKAWERKRQISLCKNAIFKIL
jgi:hypothetical protein